MPPCENVLTALIVISSIGSTFYLYRQSVLETDSILKIATACKNNMFLKFQKPTCFLRVKLTFYHHETEFRIFVFHVIRSSKLARNTPKNIFFCRYLETRFTVNCLNLRSSQIVLVMISFLKVEIGKHSVCVIETTFFRSTDPCL